MAVHATRSPDLSPAVRRLAVDAHVHFHVRERVGPTLAAAITNVSALRATGAAEGPGILLLAQCAGELVFEWLRQQASVGEWAVAPVPAESQSLWVRSASGQLVVVCGRQVVAEPGLEVIALGTDRPIEDGLGLDQTLKLAQSANAVSVLPWGFGKWMGRRGRRVRAQLASPAVADLWVGDNGGRLRRFPRPRLLVEAEARGIGVLPGTDPFPFGNDYRRVGSFGFLLEAMFDPSRPWRSIRVGLEGLRRSPPAYGHGAGWLEFGYKQVGMQVRKLFRRRSV